MTMMKTCFLMILLCCSLSMMAQTKYEVTSSLNIRSYADTDAPVWGKVNKGEILDVYEISNGWAKVGYDGGYAYVSSSYLNKVQDDPMVDLNKKGKGVDLSSWSIGTGSVKWMVYLIGLFSVVLFLIRKKRGETPLDDSESLYKINWILFLMVTVFELVYIAIMGGSSTWFCVPDKVGWLWTVINFFIFGLVVYNQILCFFNTLEDVVYNSRGCFDRRWGFYSWAGVIVGGIISGIFFSAAIPFVVVAFIICQVIQVVLIFRGVMPRGGQKCAFLCTAVYLLGSLSTVLVLAHFTALLLIVLVGYIVLSMLGASGSRSGSSRKRCENCSHCFSGDYCEYWDRYIRDPHDSICDNYR